MKAEIRRVGDCLGSCFDDAYVARCCVAFHIYDYVLLAGYFVPQMDLDGCYMCNNDTPLC